MIAQMAARLHKKRTLEGALETILGDALTFVGSKCGFIRLLDEFGNLTIVAQQGFDRTFLLGVGRMTRSSRAPGSRAAVSKQTVVIENIRDESDSPLREFAEHAELSGVLATPLVAHDGACVAALTIFFQRHRLPTDIEQRMLETYGKIAADRIISLLGPDPISEQAQQLYRRQLDESKPPKFKRPQSRSASAKPERANHSLHCLT